MSRSETAFFRQVRLDQRGSPFLRHLISLLGLVIYLGFAGSPAVLTVRADGGGPQPTQTLPAAQPTAALLAPGLLDTDAIPTATFEVKTFEIIIDTNQNATIQPLSPESEAVISSQRDLSAQATTTDAEEEFSSPLWIFGFFTLAIIILVINSVGKGLRSRA
jgi:hypothetical protein